MVPSLRDGRRRGAVTAIEMVFKGDVFHPAPLVWARIMYTPPVCRPWVGKNPKSRYNDGGKGVFAEVFVAQVLLGGERAGATRKRRRRTVPVEAEEGGGARRAAGGIEGEGAAPAAGLGQEGGEEAEAGEAERGVG
jgi:hypothetical protein